ncbi:MAG: potassium channel protein [candidate division Zixibacteria bacterium]|nr:potassium channel protein [candidate division Zixibacteria bacterium]
MRTFLFKRELSTYRNLLGMVLGVIGFGTLGFYLIEGWNFLDSLYMTITTLSMVGYGEVHPLTDNGKIFAIILIVFGIVAVTYIIGIIARFIIEGQLQKLMGKSRMEKQINKLRGHYIICGYGRVGSFVCREFQHRRVPFVVVEKEPGLIEQLQSTDIIFYEGDATEDDVLKSVGIERARGLVSTLASEADNVYLALSARHLNPDLYITCRADSLEAEKKIQRAGADRVVSPYVIGGLRMALATLRPNVIEFLHVSASSPEGNFRIEELLVKENSPVANKKLKDTDIRAKLGLIVIGIRKPDKTIIRNPSAETIIEPGDIIILLGDAMQLEKLEDATA